MRARSSTGTELLLGLVAGAYSFKDLTEFRTGMLELGDRKLGATTLAAAARAAVGVAPAEE